MELPEIKILSPKEIFALEDCHLSALLENSYGVYAPWYAVLENMHSLLKSFKGKDKSSKQAIAIAVESALVYNKIEKSQLEWGSELYDILVDRAKRMGLDVRVEDEETLSCMMDHFVDGRYMEYVYHSMNVQQYADAVLKACFPPRLHVEVLLALNIIP